MRAAADIVIGPGNFGTIVTYTALGVLTSVFAGIETAFRPDRVASNLSDTSSQAYAVVRKAHEEISRALSEHSSESSPKLRIQESYNWVNGKFADLENRDVTGFYRRRA